MWQDKVETCVSSPDPRFIHLTNLSHPHIQPSDPTPIHLFTYLFIYLFIRSFVHSPVRPSSLPACSYPIPWTDRHQWPVVVVVVGEEGAYSLTV